MKKNLFTTIFIIAVTLILGYSKKEKFTTVDDLKILSGKASVAVAGDAMGDPTGITVSMESKGNVTTSTTNAEGSFLIKIKEDQGDFVLTYSKTGLGTIKRAYSYENGQLYEYSYKGAETEKNQAVYLNNETLSPKSGVIVNSITTNIEGNFLK